MIDADYSDDLGILSITVAQPEILLHGLNHASRGIVLDVNTNKTKLIRFKRREKPKKLVDQFAHLYSNISSTESDINTHLVRLWLLYTGY